MKSKKCYLQWQMSRNKWKDLEVLSTENYETLLRKVKGDLNKGRDVLNTFQSTNMVHPPRTMSVLPMWPIDSVQFQLRPQQFGFVETDKQIQTLY